MKSHSAALHEFARKLSLLFTTVLGHARSSRLETNVMAVAEHPLVAPVVQVEGRRLAADGGELLQGMPQDRQARHGQQRLGHDVRKRSQAGAEPRREDQGFHTASLHGRRSDGGA